jgi:hypothetical protein
MFNTPEPDELLAPLSDRFEQLGLSEVAQRLRALVGPTQESANSASAVPQEVLETGLVSPADAAQLLDLRSPSTVLALADQGLLEAFELGGQRLISRRSLEAALGSPALATQRRIEAQLWALLGREDEADR